MPRPAARKIDHKNLTLEEISKKYSSIEDKVPSVFKTWEQAAISLAIDLWCTWDVTDTELYRVIAMIDLRTNKSQNLAKHLDPQFSFKGLYPHIQKPINIIDPSYKVL